MEVVRNLVQNMVFIVILAMLLEMLLPVGEMKRYVKMVMGLLIIVAVIQAVGDLVRWDYSVELPALAQKEEGMQLPAIMESGRKVTALQRQKAIEQYKSGLARQVAALAGINKDLPVVGAEVKVESGQGNPDYGQLKEIVLFIAREPGEQANKGVQGEVLEPVVVRVGSRADAVAQQETGSGPPREAAAGMINTIANFYNLRPEQVKVVYR